MLVTLFFAYALDFVEGKGYGGNSGYHSSGYSGRSGGSYGYGGSNGGGWYWLHHRDSDDTDDDQYEREQANNASTSFLIAVFIILGLLGCFYQKLSRQGRSVTLDPTRKEALCGREAALSASYLTDPGLYTKPANGVYCASYIEPSLGLKPSRKCNGETNITFQKQQRGWKMIGDGSDADGRFFIRDGFVSFDGKAVWVEVGAGNRSVSNAGDFDFTTHTFKGTWIADNGRGGAYVDFYHKASRLHGAPNKISSVNEAYAPPSLAIAGRTTSSRNACEATKENGNARMTSTDAERGVVKAALADSSSLDSKCRGVYVPPSFASAVVVTQPSNVDCASTLIPCVAPRSQRSVISAITHPYQNNTEIGANAIRPISYISSVSSEETYGMSSESMSYSGTVGSQRSRQASPSPCAPLEDDVKDVDEIQASSLPE